MSLPDLGVSRCIRCTDCTASISTPEHGAVQQCDMGQQTIGKLHVGLFPASQFGKYVFSLQSRITFSVRSMFPESKLPFSVVRCKT